MDSQLLPMGKGSAELSSQSKKEVQRNDIYVGSLSEKLNKATANSSKATQTGGQQVFGPSRLKRRN